MLSTVLLLLDNSSASRARLDLAVALAVKHHASIQATFLPPGLQSGNEQQAAELRNQFLEHTAQAGIRSAWHDLAGTHDQFWRELLHLAHCSSLVIVGQTAGEAETDLPADLSERLLAATGRPLITVPFAGRFASCGDRVLIAWSDGRESARALHDALPLLSLAHLVHLVKLITEESRIAGAGERLARVTAYLSQCGIKARGDVLLSLDFPAGDMLLNHACEDGCDLLVMGAFNESSGRASLGKVARHVLQHLTVPVLMSH